MLRRIVLTLLLVLSFSSVATAAETIRMIRFIQHPDGRCEMVFANSISGETGRVWENCQVPRDEALTLNATEDNLIKFLIAYWMARNPDFSNPNLILGKTLTIDFAAANPIKVQ